MFLFEHLHYLWMIFFIMITAGLAKEHNLFAPAFGYVKNTFRSNKFVIVLLSAIGGILPIEGRVTVSAGLLDTVAPKEGNGRQKLGIVDYLATHHYYLWSPLEKTVILPIAAFGLSYSAWLGLIWPILLVSLCFIFTYIWNTVKDEEINITPSNFKLSTVTRNVIPMILAIAGYIAGYNHIICFGFLTLYYMFITQQWNYKKLLKYVNWNLLIIVTVAIIAGNYFKSNSSFYETFISNSHLDPHTLIGISIISVLSFIASFLMGSSGKFIALAVLTSQVFGHELFLWFFTVDFVGYLLSPTHKCVHVGHQYFGTPLKTYYKALSCWSVVLLITAGLTTFLI